MMPGIIISFIFREHGRLVFCTSPSQNQLTCASQLVDDATHWFSIQVDTAKLARSAYVSDYLSTNTSLDLFALIRAALQPPMMQEDISVLTGKLLEQCGAWIQRYIILTKEQAIVLAAWILHTCVFDAAETTPYIHITAPERECRKSYLMEVLAAIAAVPICSEGMTPAALVRTIEAKRPTIFLDEMDPQLSGDKEYAETIRGILNAGFERVECFESA